MRTGSITSWEGRWGTNLGAAVAMLGLALFVVPIPVQAQQIIPGKTPIPIQAEESTDKAAVAEKVAPAGQPRRLSVLVHMAPGADRGPVRGFAAAQGGQVKYEYDILPNVINLRGIPAGVMNALRATAGVVKVEDDKEVHAHMNDSIPLIRALPSQLAAAGFSADGTGVRVCIIDTGIDSDHIMYSTRIDTAAGRDFVNNDNNPEDDAGHGSHVSGTAVGGSGLTVNFGCIGPEPFQGVAPEATLIGIKVLNASGSGSFSDVIAGINYGADQTASGGRCDVINMSLGGGSFSGSCDGDSAAAASNNAVDAGVVVVASSGNDGFSNSMGTPACGSKVIAVGLTFDDSYPSCEFPSQTSFGWCFNPPGCTSSCTDVSPSVDEVSCMSNKSTELDVTAPGCITFSADKNNSPSGLVGFCGTSMASPHVAGLAALLLSADPSLTPAQVRQHIRNGAIDLGPNGFDNAYGWGRIDAINSLAFLTPQCQVPADCDDLDACTVDACNSGSCSNTPINCDDLDACTTDSCSGGVCSNVPIDCDDLDACTTDSCSGGVCSNDPIDCDDLDACTTDSCSGGLCSNVVINCDDSNECTSDSCLGGACQNIAVADDTLCSDGLCCGGTCGAPACSFDIDCDDTNDCTTDACNSAGLCAASCSNTPVSCPPGESCVGGVCLPQDCNNDSTCDSGEDCNNCPADCISGTSSGAVCGNGLCEAGDGEDCLSCPQDCNGKQNGKPSGRFCCGNGGVNPVGCDAGLCGPDCTLTPVGGGTTFCCGDTVCEGDEDSFNCAVDCGDPPFCGDANCDPGEDSCNCQADCGAPAAGETSCTDGVDNDCDSFTDCDDSDCSGDPACNCVGKKASCNVNSDCCSGNCKNGSCKGN